MRSIVWVFVLFSLFLLSDRSRASQPFVVNETTSGQQAQASVAQISGAGFVVAWTSRPTFPPTPVETYARLFDSSGTPVTGEFAIADPPGEHLSPATGVDSLGRFVVVTEVRDQATSTFGLYGSRYDDTGSGITTGVQLVEGLIGGRHAFAMRPSGSGTLAWVHYGDTTRVWARDFDASLAPSSSPVLVAEYPEPLDLFVAVAVHPSGTAAVVWTAPAATSDDRYVLMRGLYPLTAPVTVSDVSTLNSAPDIAVDSSGRAVVVWRSLEDGPFSGTIRMRRFDASGAADGPSVVVDDGLGYCADPAIAVNGSDVFAVLWSVRYGTTSDSNGWQIRGRRYCSDGTPSGPSFLVSDFHPDAGGLGSLYPDALHRDDGAIVAVWTDEDAGDSDVLGNVIAPGATAVAPLPAPVGLSSHPNPFSGSTTVSFVLPAAVHARVEVYDVTGRLVRRLVDGRNDAGPHSVAWDGKDAGGRRAPSGVYFCRVSLDGRMAAAKMIKLE